MALLICLNQGNCSGCPATSVMNPTLNYCYWTESDRESFWNANALCSVNGGLLAKIPDIAALEFIQNNLGFALG